MVVWHSPCKSRTLPGASNENPRRKTGVFFCRTARWVRSGYRVPGGDDRIQYCLVAFVIRTGTSRQIIAADLGGIGRIEIGVENHQHAEEIIGGGRAVRAAT